MRPAAYGVLHSVVATLKSNDVNPKLVEKVVLQAIDSENNQEVEMLKNRLERAKFDFIDSINGVVPDSVLASPQYRKNVS